MDTADVQRSPQRRECVGQVGRRHIARIAHLHPLDPVQLQPPDKFVIAPLARSGTTTPPDGQRLM